MMYPTTPEYASILILELLNGNISKLLLREYKYYYF